MIMVTWLLTVAGKDQPQLLQKFCESIALMEGVFLDSQQAVMAGRLTALYKVCIPAKHVAFARSVFSEFARQGVEVVTIDELDEDTEYSPSYLVLDLQGQYRFGIDHDIRMILESHGADTEHLNQYYLGDSLVGEHQFSTRIRAVLSRPVSEPDLLGALYRLTPGLKIRLSVVDDASVLVS
ncbi:ACT domain-containing protein [uncultured Amphritea sp.]|uniref:ACT domain-containing protein n=1 Tax=Amphritea sp. TaxID=1872502 RepID=UPI0025CBDBF4|nr:ACT domain-containing protein [uncultured Amphritea sp.]